MSFRIDHLDTNTLLVLDLPEGHQVQARSGSMIAVSGSVKIIGKVRNELDELASLS